VYDGNFAGLLTVIFEVYERKLADVSIVREDFYQPHSYAVVQTITRDASTMTSAVKLHLCHVPTRYWRYLTEKQ
jgi:hypothetical protein